jgi:tRNAThr (cytosine32-N3)-methyltransferase
MDSKRPVREDLFGQRYLTEDHDVFSHNAWDEVEFPEAKLEEINEILERQRSSMAENGEAIISTTDQSWDQFYERHSTSFFKDRKWLFREFAEIFREPEDKVTSNLTFLMHLFVLETNKCIGSWLRRR